MLLVIMIVLSKIFSVFTEFMMKIIATHYLSNPVEIEVSWYDDNLYFQGETY